MTLIASLACMRGRIARITWLRQEDFDYDQQRAHAERRGGDALVEMDQYILSWMISRLDRPVTAKLCKMATMGSVSEMLDV